MKSCQNWINDITLFEAIILFWHSHPHNVCHKNWMLDPQRSERSGQWRRILPQHYRQNLRHKGFALLAGAKFPEVQKKGQLYSSNLKTMSDIITEWPISPPLPPLCRLCGRDALDCRVPVLGRGLSSDIPNHFRKTLSSGVDSAPAVAEIFTIGSSVWPSESNQDSSRINERSKQPGLRVNEAFIM